MVRDPVEHVFGGPERDDAVGRLAGEYGDRVGARLAAPLDVQGLPWAALFVLGDAEGPLAWMREGRFILFAGPRAAQVPPEESQGPPDGAVGARAVAEDPVGRVESEGRPLWSVDDHEGHTHVGRAGDAVQIVLGGERRRERRLDDRQMARHAARHHGVRRDEPAGRGDAARRNRTEDLVGVGAARLEHRVDAIDARQHHRQSIRPALGVEMLEQLVVARFEGSALVPEHLASWVSRPIRASWVAPSSVSDRAPTRPGQLWRARYRPRGHRHHDAVVQSVRIQGASSRWTPSKRWRPAARSAI